MKKMILTGTVILALATAGLQSARAGDREWATVGKLLTGVAVAGLIVAATDGHAQMSVSYAIGAPAPCPAPPPPCNAYPVAPPPVVYFPPAVAPTVVLVPAPVVVCRAPVVICPPQRHVRYERRHDRW